MRRKWVLDHVTPSFLIWSLGETEAFGVWTQSMTIYGANGRSLDRKSSELNGRRVTGKLADACYAAIAYYQMVGDVEGFPEQEFDL